MTDQPQEIPTRDRIMALLSPPSQSVNLTVDDARWIKDEIERLKSDVKAAFEESWRRGCEIDRLRAALERIRDWPSPDARHVKTIAREALRDD